MARLLRMRAVGGQADGQTFELPDGTVEFEHRQVLDPVITVAQPYRVAVTGTKTRILFPKGWSIDMVIGHLLDNWQPGERPAATLDATG